MQLIRDSRLRPCLAGCEEAIAGGRGYGQVVIALALAGGFATSGCGLTTDFPSQKQVGVGQVASRIQCQLRDVVNALAVNYPEFKEDWTGGFDLTLQAKRTASGSFKPLNWTIPGSSLKLAGSAEGSEDTDRKVVTKYQFNLVDLDTLTCPQPVVSSGFAEENLFEPVADYVPNLYGSRLVGLGPKPSLTYEVTFIVTHAADIGPTFTIVNLSATANASGKRIDTNKMTASFVRNPPGTVARGVGVPPAAATEIENNIRDLTQPQAVRDFFNEIATE